MRVRILNHACRMSRDIRFASRRRALYHNPLLLETITDGPRHMTIKLRSEDEIARMRVAGRLAASVLEMIGPYVEPGVTTEELDRICHRYIVDELDAIPAPLNYSNAPGQPPFPEVDLYLGEPRRLSRHPCPENASSAATC